jgi:hypothetical protein
MSTPTVLFFGRNPAMMRIVDLQLKAAGVEAQGYMDEAELRAELDKGAAKLLVIGGGVEDDPRSRMKAYCAGRGILVLEHSAGPGTLPGNIAEVLG